MLNKVLQNRSATVGHVCVSSGMTMKDPKHAPSPLVSSGDVHVQLGVIVRCLGYRLRRGTCTS